MSSGSKASCCCILCLFCRSWGGGKLRRRSAPLRERLSRRPRGRTRPAGDITSSLRLCWCLRRGAVGFCPTASLSAACWRLSLLHKQPWCQVEIWALPHWFFPCVVYVSIDWLIVSPSGFGVKKISTATLKPSQYVPIHSKQIRGLAFSRHQDSLLLSAALDNTIKLTRWETDAFLLWNNCVRITFSITKYLRANKAHQVTPAIIKWHIKHKAEN